MTDNIINLPGSEPELTPSERGERIVNDLLNAMEDLYKIARDDARLLPHIGYQDDLGNTNGLSAVLAKLKRDLAFIATAHQNALAGRSLLPVPVRKGDLQWFTLRGRNVL